MRGLNLMRQFITIFFAALLFSACSKEKNNGGIPVPDPYANKLNEFSITPSMANATINTFDNSHLLFVDTRVSSKKKLFVFLPGTSGFPSVYSLVLKKAAALGYHAIGLMYPNSSDLYIASATSADNSMFGRCRQEIFDGTDMTASVSIQPENSIKGRLLSLLQYLNRTYPTLGWGQFLLAGQIDWSKCIIAGHSQGGGHAIYISKKVLVSRAVSFASMDWNTNLNTSAAWIAEPGVTPASQLYSFISPRDQVFDYVKVERQLTELGITGSPVSIDTETIPYSNSHRLITTATPAIGILFPDHNITCLDNYVPKTSTGAALGSFENAWGYLIGN